MFERRNGDTLNLGVAGLGYWGPNLVRVLAEMEGVRVTRMCDPRPERLERLGRRYPATRATVSFDELLACDDVDAVAIATPVYTHYELVSRSLEAGKHTFVEKPLAPSGEQADDLIAIAEESGLLLMCGHTFLYSSPVRAVKGLLERDEIGDVYFISSSRVNLGLHQQDVSVVWDLGPHDFSILLHWMEEMPESIRAVGRDSVIPGIHDVAFVTMTFPSGVVANVELSWLAPSKLRRTVIVGSERMVVYDDASAEPVRVFDHGVEYRDPETFGEYQLAYRTGDIVSPKIDTTEPLQVEFEDFVESIRSGNRPTSHAALARDVVRLTEAAQESLTNGGEQVILEGAWERAGR